MHEKLPKKMSHTVREEKKKEEATVEEWADKKAASVCQI